MRDPACWHTRTSKTMHYNFRYVPSTCAHIITLSSIVFTLISTVSTKTNEDKCGALHFLRSLLIRKYFQSQSVIWQSKNFFWLLVRLVHFSRPVFLMQPTENDTLLKAKSKFENLPVRRTHIHTDIQ